MLNFNDVSLKQTRFYQDVFGEGRVEGEAALLLRQLERKFHPLSESARRRIAAADAEPCWCGASASLMPTVWRRFGG
ncbi:MAG: hypothetical protein ACOYMG_24580, partial [Candidatus Methylumidiphilus sp.]